MATGVLLDQHGRPLGSSPKEIARGPAAVDPQVRAKMIQLFQQNRMMRAKFDAAQTFTANENHWSNTDHLDPHSVASLSVRRMLRSRSRYEIVENNPYLKGTALTIVNDFVGSGPTLQITDDRYSKTQRDMIHKRFNKEWAAGIKLRQKLWRMRMAKMVDGEAFALFYNRKRKQYPHTLDLYVIECDRVSGQNTAYPDPTSGVAEIDGVRFDAYENPVSYFVLHQHPGGSSLTAFATLAKDNGAWHPADQVLHWFRQDRGWLRGIPETTPSLPLCALLRRYTLATVRNAEVIADFTVLLETQNPASATPFGGRDQEDDPFDLFPLEMGMAMNLPFGMTAKQLESVPLGANFDAFVGCLLREITRPLLTPYNISIGSSKDSNMASAVVDQNIYKGGQTAERYHCEESVLEPVFSEWWFEAARIPGYLGRIPNGEKGLDVPEHRWRWDLIGIDHTDPQKVAEAIKIMHENRFITDADIQEGRFNRDVDSWREEITEDDKFRSKLKPINPADRLENQPKPRPPSGGGGSSPKKPKPKAKKK